MLKSLFTFVLLFTVHATRAAAPLDCPATVAEALLEVMPEMGATAYAPGRYGLKRSTCGSAENGPYCLGRDFHDVRHDPVYRQDAETYARGLSACGVPRDGQGRLQTGEIRCRPDAGATCRIFAPEPAPTNWPARAPVAPQTPEEDEDEEVPADEDAESEDSAPSDEEAAEASARPGPALGRPAQRRQVESDDDDEEDRPSGHEGGGWRERAGGVWNSVVSGVGSVTRGAQRRWSDWRGRRSNQSESEADEEEPEAEDSEKEPAEGDGEFVAPDGREGYSDRPRDD